MTSVQNGGPSQRIVMLVYSDLSHDARVVKEATTLSRAGFEVCVVSLLSVGGYRERQHPGAFMCFEIPKAGASVPKFLRRAMALLTTLRMMWVAWRLKGVIYHLHDANVLLQGFLVARILGAKLVYDAHEISSHREGYSKVLALLVRWIESAIVPRVDRMLTTTSMRAEFFKKAYRGAPAISVVQNRPMFRARTSAPNRSAALHTLLGIPNSSKIVLYQGGLQAGRGLENFIALSPKFPELHFVLIGSGSLETQLKENVKSKGWESNVHFVAKVPLAELPTYTEAAFVGVQIIQNTCLNHYTTDSNKLFEYAMAGLPVLASDFPEIRKVVEGNGLGLLVDPDNLTAIESALRKFLNDSDFYQQCVRSAVQSAQNLSWESQESVLLGEVYRGILGSPAA